VTRRRKLEDLAMAARSASRLIAVLITAILLQTLADPGIAREADDPQQGVLEKTSSVRGLAVLGDVPVEFVTPEQVRADLERQTGREESRARLEVTQKLLTELGLLSHEQPLSDLLVSTYGGAIGGYYNRHLKRMYVVGDALQFGPRERLTLAHEFAHALQDQHFNLTELIAASRENDDRAAAVAALIEGDANLTSFEFARLHMSQQDRQALLASNGSRGWTRLHW
jgi:hypothetical protein